MGFFLFYLISFLNNLSIYLCINGKLYCLLWAKEPKQGTTTHQCFIFQFCDVAQVVIGVHKYI
jgi:hypothetical protein